jgi:transposase
MHEGRSEMFFCGIDVAKHAHAVLVVDEAGRVVQPAFSIENRRESFDHLATTLAAFSEPVGIGMEATGHYWLALYDDLTQRGYPVTVINAFACSTAPSPSMTPCFPVCS